ncbi:MAG TPA: hypothetical protein VL404_02625 [Candidatus Eisenbacteria bacterium]|nr:hypothetical protein [Candidatus Eisenbacteria bacterium]
MKDALREILIQTKVSENHKRKNLSIVETIDQNGFTARAEKKYSYYVSEQSPFKDPDEMKTWMNVQSHAYHKKDRHVSIRKIYDGKSGVGQMVYRVIGSFYVVQDLHIFAVVFMHSIKFDMVSDKLPLGGGLSLFNTPEAPPGLI